MAKLFKSNANLLSNDTELVNQHIFIFVFFNYSAGLAFSLETCLLLVAVTILSWFVPFSLAAFSVLLTSAFSDVCTRLILGPFPLFLLYSPSSLGDLPQSPGFKYRPYCDHSKFMYLQPQTFSELQTHVASGQFDIYPQVFKGHLEPIFKTLIGLFSYC